MKVNGQLHASAPGNISLPLNDFIAMLMAPLGNMEKRKFRLVKGVPSSLPNICEVYRTDVQIQEVTFVLLLCLSCDLLKH
jgi:hypothetical protein